MSDNKQLVAASKETGLAIPDLKGKQGTVKASEETSTETEIHKEVKKTEGDKNIVQKAHGTQKEDSSKSVEASVKTTALPGGGRRTVHTTMVSSSSSFEQEETMETSITSAPKKCITQK